jgi:hypothetical protein
VQELMVNSHFSLYDFRESLHESRVGFDGSRVRLHDSRISVADLHSFFADQNPVESWNADPDPYSESVHNINHIVDWSLYINMFPYEFYTRTISCFVECLQNLKSLHKILSENKTLNLAKKTKFHIKVYFN